MQYLWVFGQEPNPPRGRGRHLRGHVPSLVLSVLPPPWSALSCWILSGGWGWLPMPACLPQSPRRLCLTPLLLRCPSHPGQYQLHSPPGSPRQPWGVSRCLTLQCPVRGVVHCLQQGDRCGEEDTGIRVRNKVSNFKYSNYLLRSSLTDC